MIDNSNQTPINKTASLVIGKGVSYDCPKKILVKESKNPMPTRSPSKTELGMGTFKDCTGFLFGRLKAVGLYAHGKGWVCRCACGVYCIRKTKSILNKNNTGDRCEECRHLVYLKRSEHFRRTGKDKSITEFE